MLLTKKNLVWFNGYGGSMTKKMTKINNQQPSEFAGKSFIMLLTHYQVGYLTKKCCDFCHVDLTIWPNTVGVGTLLLGTEQQSRFKNSNMRSSKSLIYPFKWKKHQVFWFKSSFRPSFWRGRYFDARYYRRSKHEEMGKYRTINICGSATIGILPESYG